jgi:D-galactarolactone cycloisomerase
MKITDVQATYIEVPFNEPGLESITAPGIVHKSWGFTLVKVFTDEGLVGYGGQNTRFGKWGPHWTEYINLVVGPQLVAQQFDPFLVGKFSEEIVSQAPSFVSPRPSCVEMAMWDIVGKAAGQPVYRLFGAKRDKVKAYASSFPQYPRWGAKEWADWAELCRKEGFRAVKVKQNDPDIEKDVENIQAIRSAVGNEVDIMVDTWQAWTPSPYDLQKAIKLARRYEEYDVYWMEEPVPHLLNPNVSKALCAAVDIPIAGGGQILGLHTFKVLLENDVLDIIQPDVEHAGGMLEVRNIALMAESQGKWCCPHTFGPGLLLAANLQVLGATNAPYVEVPFFPPAITHEVRDSVLAETIGLDADGYVQIPQNPGLGVEVSEAAVERMAVGFSGSAEVLRLGGRAVD